MKRSATASRATSTARAARLSPAASDNASRPRASRSWTTERCPAAAARSPWTTKARRPRARHRHRHLRQGRAERARRRGPAHVENRGSDRRRHQPVSAVDALVEHIADGAFIALAPDYSLPAMEAVRALIRKKARNLKL